MTTCRTLDVSHLPDHAISPDAPLWWGQLLTAFIEGTMFAILIAMYFYYRLSVDVWPPPGTELPRVVLPTISLFLMFVSTLGSYRASEAAKRDDSRGIIVWLLFNLILGCAALVCRGFAWASLQLHSSQRYSRLRGLDHPGPAYA